MSTQKLFAALKYAEVILWSPPQPIGAIDEHISVLMQQSALSPDMEN